MDVMTIMRYFKLASENLSKDEWFHAGQSDR
jgi:hypothetical protein